MMKKKIIKFAIVGVLAIAGTLGYNFTMNPNDANFQLIMDNVEALAQGEGGLDCRYNRHPSTCSIYVGVNGRIKLLGGVIIKAGADGYARFDGQVSCSSGGTFACTPVECRELYETILH